MISVPGGDTCRSACGVAKIIAFATRSRTNVAVPTAPTSVSVKRATSCGLMPACRSVTTGSAMCTLGSSICGRAPTNDTFIGTLHSILPFRTCMIDGRSPSFTPTVCDVNNDKKSVATLRGVLLGRSGSLGVCARNGALCVRASGSHLVSVCKKGKVLVHSIGICRNRGTVGGLPTNVCFLRNGGIVVNGWLMGLYLFFGVLTAI